MRADDLLLVYPSSPRPVDVETPISPGEYILWWRTLQGISQRELARRMGISHVFLGEIERGQRPPSEKVLRKLQKLGANTTPIRQAMTCATCGQRLRSKKSATRGKK